MSPMSHTFHLHYAHYGRIFNALFCQGITQNSAERVFAWTWRWDAWRLYHVESALWPPDEIISWSKLTIRHRSSLGEPMTIDKPIKRLRLTEQNKTDEQSRTISSDSGIFITQNKNKSTSTSNNETDVETFHWWHKTHRTRRLSTESIVSTDSITREINKPLWYNLKNRPPEPNISTPSTIRTRLFV